MTASTARRRSFWHWGFEDAFPDEAGRANLAAQVGFLLGREFAVGPLPRLADARLPSPRAPVPPAVAAFASDAREDRIHHTYGKSFVDLVRAHAGDFASAPDFVLHPRAEDDVAQALAVCERESIAVVPYGGGTSVVGGVEAQASDLRGFRGVACLDLRAMDRVLEVDAVSRAARIQAGATGPVLDAQLAEHGLSLRHFPQSYELSTLGGWIATRAGGHFATLYTHIDDLVQSVRVVTPRGIVATRRLPASGAGPSPERLFLGSEGALGVITEAWVRVQARPRFRSSATMLFDTFERGVEAVRAVSQAALFPSNCRLLDAREALFHGAGDGQSAVLLLGFESADHALEEKLARAIAIAEAHGGRLARPPVHRTSGARGSDATSESWRASFFAAPYRQSALLTLGVMADTFETACTWDRFAACHRAITTALEDALLAHAGGGVWSCRFTHVYPDGPAPYYTFVAQLPARPLESWRAIKGAVSDAILESGATITHHHAVGRTHHPWYARERPALFGDAVAAVKRTLDPPGILNPGVLVGGGNDE